MPKIPVLNQSPQMSVSSPVGIGGTEDARYSGQQISSTGEGLVRLGASFKENEDRDKAVRRNLDWQTAQNELHAKALELENKIRLTGKSDGSDYIENFVNPFKEFQEEIAERYVDPVTKQGVKVQAGNVQNTFVDKLGDTARMKFVEYGSRQIKDNLNRKTNLVQQDPEQRDDLLIQGLLEIRSSEAWMTQDAMDKAAIDYRKEITNSAVQGYSASKQYDKAREVIATNGDFLDPKERAFELATIDQAEDEHRTETLQAEMREEQFNEKRVNKFKEKVAATAYAMAVEAKTPADREKARAFALSNHKAILMDNNNLNAVMSVLDKYVEADDEFVMTKFVRQVAIGDKSSDQLIKEVTIAHNTEQLGSKNAQEMFKMLIARKEREKTDPKFKAMEKVANELLDAYLLPDSVIEKMTNPGPHLIRKAEARMEMYKLMYNNNMDPESAFKRVKRNYKAAIFSRHVYDPKLGANQHTKAGLAQDRDNVLKLQAEGKITLKEAIQRLEAIQSRLPDAETRIIEEGGEPDGSNE